MPPCPNPACPGHVEDGFCDTCGRAAAPATATTARPGGYGGGYTRTTGRLTGARRPVAAGSARSARSRGSSRTQALGGGLVTMPAEPSMNPLSLLLADPRVPEGKAACPSCGNRVNSDKRFCPNCGAEYDFRPTLHAGDVLAGHYEVKGPIAFGGLG